MKLLDQYIREIEKELETKKTPTQPEEIGTLVELKDEIAILSGLDSAFYGEIIEFDNSTKGFIVDLLEDSVGAVVLGNYLNLKVGSKARGTNRILSIPVGDDLIGQVVDALALPIVSKKKIRASKYYPVEKIAPGVIYRQPVNVPLQTGIKAIDALVPIGRGQRELIIGDRVTGKTTLVIDTIINQKQENVICIYCAIGQKNANVASIVETLNQHEAMDYTIIVSASSSEPVAMQYLAPYAATAIGEFFMDQGKDVLVVYDDLSKHAWAYRQISLILRRPAGREAYPGDIFYLHSRLLERACRIAKKFGGGSLTALPIVETLEGDIAGYIPTNIISITDGQIFLETELFNSGIRPAINVGISVSRVGGNAQTKAMKQVAGQLKLDLAQYRELSSFSQFESDLDQETKTLLNRGAKITQVLKQDKNKTYSLAQQVVILWAAKNGYLDNLDLEAVQEFEEKLLADLKTKENKLLAKINKDKVIAKEDESKLKKLVSSNL